jgi:hypothetical protein
VALLHGPTEARRAAGNTLGAWAAASGVHLQDLVAAVLEAAAGVWDRMAPGAAGSPAQVRREGAELLECTRSALASALDGYARRNRAELERYDDDRTDFLNDLLTGRAEPGALAERAHRYGIRLSATHVVMVARAAGLTADIAHRVDAALAARFGDGNTLTTLRGGELVCISAGGLRGVGAELAHQLLTVLGTGKWQLAVGCGHPGLRGLATSLDEARGTLEHAEKLGFTAPVLNAADLLVFPVLLRDREAIVDLVTTVLGPLREGPRRHPALPGHPRGPLRQPGQPQRHRPADAPVGAGRHLPPGPHPGVDRLPPRRAHPTLHPAGSRPRRPAARLAGRSAMTRVRPRTRNVGTIAVADRLDARSATRSAQMMVSTALYDDGRVIVPHRV